MVLESMNHTKFLDLVKEFGLESELNKPNITILVPTNEAIQEHMDNNVNNTEVIVKKIYFFFLFLSSFLLSFLANFSISIAISSCSKDIEWKGHFKRFCFYFEYFSLSTEAFWAPAGTGRKPLHPGTFRSKTFVQQPHHADSCRPSDESQLFQRSEFKAFFTSLVPNIIIASLFCPLTAGTGLLLGK